MGRSLRAREKLGNRISERSPQWLHRMCLPINSKRIMGVRGIRRVKVEPQSGQLGMAGNPVKIE